MLKVTRERRIMWIRFEGAIDRKTENELEQTLVWGLDDVEELWIDMAGAEEVSSVTLRILSYAKKEISKRGEVHIIHMDQEAERKLWEII